MSLPDLRLHPEASVEFGEAFAWYFERSHQIAEEFDREIDRALHHIRTSPQRWPLFRGRYHRIMVRRFPFYLVYEINDSSIMVLAVAHGRRKPGYWQGRN
jgi:plasmid stabilization system protein ParE